MWAVSLGSRSTQRPIGLRLGLGLFVHSHPERLTRPCYKNAAALILTPEYIWPLRTPWSLRQGSFVSSFCKLRGTALLLQSVCNNKCLHCIWWHLVLPVNKQLHHAWYGIYSVLFKFSEGCQLHLEVTKMTSHLVTFSRNTKLSSLPLDM